MVNRNDALVSATVVGGQIVYTEGEFAARVSAPSCKRDAFCEAGNSDVADLALSRRIVMRGVCDVFTDSRAAESSRHRRWQVAFRYRGIFSEASIHRRLVACEMHEIPERRHIMAMNLLHRRRCSSAGWADMVRDELLPWALADVELGGPDPRNRARLRCDAARTRRPGRRGHSGRSRQADGRAAATAVRRPGAGHSRRRQRIPACPTSRSARWCASRCFITSPRIGCKISCSPRHFESCGPAGCLPAATACRRCRSGSSISATPTTRSDRTR